MDSSILCSSYINTCQHSHIRLNDLNHQDRGGASHHRLGGTSVSHTQLRAAPIFLQRNVLLTFGNALLSTLKSLGCKVIGGRMDRNLHAVLANY